MKAISEYSTFSQKGASNLLLSPIKLLGNSIFAVILKYREAVALRVPKRIPWQCQVSSQERHLDNEIPDSYNFIHIGRQWPSQGFLHTYASITRATMQSKVGCD